MECSSSAHLINQFKYVANSCDFNAFNIYTWLGSFVHSYQLTLSWHHMMNAAFYSITVRLLRLFFHPLNQNKNQICFWRALFLNRVVNSSHRFTGVRFVAFIGPTFETFAIPAHSVATTTGYCVYCDSRALARYQNCQTLVCFGILA